MPLLPVPTAVSEIPGNFLASAIWNASVANAIGFLTNPPIATLVQTSVQATTSTITVALTWPTPTVDTYGGYAAGNPTRYTPQVPGYYLIVGNVGFAANATGGRSAQVAKNGAAVVNEASVGNAGAVFTTVVGVTSLVFCNGTTDYLELNADQNSGAGINTVVGRTSFTVMWIHA